MRPLNSSTSNSEPPDALETASGGSLRDTLAVAAWFVLFLVAGDLLVGAIISRSSGDPKRRPGALAEYFNYGLSIEGKIRRAVGATDESTSPVMLAGWIDDEVRRGRDQKPPRDSLSVSFYGMSFSNDVARALCEIDPKIHVRLFAGPAAPPNHSFATYELDGGGPSRVLVLGILGSSIAGLETTNGMTWRFEGPAPFTYPRYRVQTGAVVPQWNGVRTLAELRKTLANPTRWNRYLGELRETDTFYNRFLFCQDIGDRSTLVKMVRRAVAQRWQASRYADIHTAAGFKDASPAIQSLRIIVSAFASHARHDGKLPIVLLIQDQGYRDHIYRALAEVLKRDKIAYLSTHTICPDTDRRNFVSDGHFTHAANERIAGALRDLIQGKLH